MKHGTQFQFWHDESGAVAATYALSLIGILGVAGVGMDYARLAGMDSELQNGADQAAIAAASQLDGNTGACARAAGAANALVANQTLLASGDNAVAIPLETTCDATGQVRFWQDKTKSTAATSDSNANYVEVFVTARSVDYALLPVTGALRSADIQGIALAGLGSSICKVPPIMICNPLESSDPGFDIDAYKGDGVRLVANDGGGYTPGNFGYLETNAGNGAIATARTLGRVEVPGDCIAADGVTTKPGEQISVLDALNTRFDIFDNGLNNSCADAAECPPSANSRKDLLKKAGPQCGIGNQGWQVGPNPYRPSSSTMPLSNTEADALDPMGYPRDMCHAISPTGNCALDRVGDGVWDRNAYFRTNSHIYSTIPANTAFRSDGAAPTRYDVYKYEAANNLLATANVGNLRAAGAPICGAPGVPVNSAQPDRRVLSVAVINCTAEGVIGKTTGVDVQEWIDVFLVEPSANRGNGGSRITDKSDVYVEIIGSTTLGGGSTAGQEIRKDVPYLIE
uniref:pilus assembly protein TadG-related protein n=1 Tax=uncultured Erythrobacter sp. TaxID=263913 RepID=UPI002623D39E|nr:pilus assembly protein TadG-related protein [uncultured Erythrobacter sp.]